MAPRGATLAMLLAVVLAWVNGVLVRTITFDVPVLGDAADRDDYRLAAGAALMTALLLVLGTAAVRVLRVPPWLQYVAAAGAATQLALGVVAWSRSRPADDTEVVTSSLWDGGREVLETAGCWLLLLVLVIALERWVRGRSSRSRR